MDRSLVLAESPAPRSSALCSANTNLNLEMAHLKLSPQAVRIIKMEKFETGRPQTPPRPSASRRENPRRCSASSGTARASTSTPANWQARYSSLTGMCCSIANSRTASSRLLSVRFDCPGGVRASFQNSPSEAIYDYAEALCQAAGTTMAKLLRAQYFVADVAVFPGVAMAWSTRFGRQPHPFVCVQTPTPMPAPGTAVIADFWISTLQ